MEIPIFQTTSLEPWQVMVYDVPNEGTAITYAKFSAPGKPSGKEILALIKWAVKRVSGQPAIFIGAEIARLLKPELSAIEATN